MWVTDVDYTIKVKMDNGKEAVVHVRAENSQEAFERAKLTYPNWQNLFLEASWDPTNKMEWEDLDLGLDDID